MGRIRKVKQMGICKVCGSEFLKQQEKSTICSKACKRKLDIDIRRQKGIKEIPCLTDEIWWPVPGYEKYYHVSNMGRIKSIFWHYKLIKPSNNGNGYLYFTPRSEQKEKKKHIYIHQLVAQVLLPNPENKPQVNHINANKHDNKVENLEWATSSENVYHAHRLGLHKFSIKRNIMLKERNRTLTSKQVIDINTNKVYLSIREAAEAIGVPYSYLKNNLRSRCKVNKTSIRYFEENHFAAQEAGMKISRHQKA